MAQFSNSGTQLFCLLFVVIGMVAVGVDVLMMIKILQSEHWPVTECIIQSVEMKSHNRPFMPSSKLHFDEEQPLLLSSRLHFDEEQPLLQASKLLKLGQQRLLGLFWKAKNGQKQLLQVQNQPFRRDLTVRWVSDSVT